jgi:NNP family nitrate/nitrite transporter-like MFS transporter
LTKDQIENINIAAVLVTIFVRIIIGPLCDRFGPRRAYTWLLIIGALPVFGLAFSQNYATLLFFRLCIGAIGASFVISQYHTSVMFAPNVVGTANATVGGWGNAGAGAAQSLMALIARSPVGARLARRPVRSGHRDVDHGLLLRTIYARYAARRSHRSA